MQIWSNFPFATSEHHAELALFLHSCLSGGVSGIFLVIAISSWFAAVCKQNGINKHQRYQREPELFSHISLTDSIVNI